MPRQARPTHHKPDSIRLVGVDWNPKTQQWSNHPDNNDPKILQILKFKFCTDTNGHEIAAHIHDKYWDLASAIHRAGKWQDAIEIHPILVFRTGNVFSTPWQSLNRLTYFAAGRPPDAGTHAAKR
eukprot:scaffold460478_cov45-Prasinocladus_malaysianus.AAC.1